jgi:imidazolonepropionase
MEVLFTNIGQLLQIREPGQGVVAGSDMDRLPLLNNAFLKVENGRIAQFGEMRHCPEPGSAKVEDLYGRAVMPGWCDSHTHLVYAGSREQEFVDRIRGLSYEEIAKRGGGILNSARQLQEVSEEELHEQSQARIRDIIAAGTVAVEIKSGYGLEPEAEKKMLRVARRLSAGFPLAVRTTYLPAHALPQEYAGRKGEYLDRMLSGTLSEIASEGLADYIDIFCERGFFDLSDTRKVLEAGARHDLLAKIHVNQFSSMGGVAVAAEFGALTVDHLEVLEEGDIAALQGKSTLPVALPGCSLFLGIPYTPARRIIDAGLPLVLATDYNPGSAPSGNMNLVVSLACIKMGMTPEEAINAATINGAWAMGLGDELGSITVGKRAHLIVTRALNSYAQLPYSFGQSLIDRVYLDGQVWESQS